MLSEPLRILKSSFAASMNSESLIVVSPATVSVPAIVVLPDPDATVKLPERISRLP